MYKASTNKQLSSSNSNNIHEKKTKNITQIPNIMADTMADTATAYLRNTTDTAYLRNTFSLMGADDYEEQDGIPIPPHIQKWRKMYLLEKLKAENANLREQVQALRDHQQLVEIDNIRLLEVGHIIQEQRAQVALLKEEIKSLEA